MCLRLCQHYTVRSIHTSQVHIYTHEKVGKEYRMYYHSFDARRGLSLSTYSYVCMYVFVYSVNSTILSSRVLKCVYVCSYQHHGYFCMEVYVCMDVNVFL